MKKRWIAILLTLTMVLSLSACGGVKDKDGMENEDAKEEEESASVKSTHGMIEVTLVDGYEVTVDTSYEMLMIFPEGSENLQHDRIEITCASEETTAMVEQFGYEPGTGYTMDSLRADIDAEIEEYEIYSNPTDVTLGAYDYIRCEATTNGSDSYYYTIIVDDTFCSIKVIGGDILDIDSDDVNMMLESIVYGEYQEEEAEVEEEEKKSAEEEGIIYDGYYSFDVPDGFNLSGEKYQETFECSDYRTIQILIKSDTADEIVEADLARGMDYADVGEVTYGDYTWRMETFTWNGIASGKYIMDLPDGENSVQVTLFCIPPEDELTNQIMESIKFEDDIYDSYMAYRNKVNEVE